MNYPDYFYGDTTTFMQLPMAYQEFLVRWYYYDNTDETELPDTVPIEHIEDYIVDRMNTANMWCAKGFAIAREVSEGDNLDFKNDAGFHTFVLYVARLYFKAGVKNKWFVETITKEDFIKECHALRGSNPIRF
jgi:hypothetical protein